MSTRAPHPRPTVLASPLIQALAHPLRSEIVEILTVEGACTLERLARATGRSRGVVADHVRVLAECGAVETVEAAPGVTAYRPGTRAHLTAEEWAQVPLEQRRELDRALLGRIAGHVAAAAGQGGFDRTDSHAAWYPVSLDQDAHAQLAELMDEVYERTMAIQAASDARRAGDAPRDDEIKSEVVVLHFLRDPSDAAPPAAASVRARERMHELTDDLADEVPSGTTDWSIVAEKARELATLAEQRIL
ncbi:MAG TPA: helix-turn-helix domain-containing protein [Solirubrobacteraceae bacterium]